MNWDQYFLNICDVISENSKCYSRKVGAIIVKDKSIISTGYNGPPRGVPPCDERYNNMLDTGLVKEFIKRDIPYRSGIKNCPRRILNFKSREGLEWCVAGHGERNALINAARVGVSVKDCIMYMNCAVPCSPCLVEIINAGISEIVVTGFDHYDMMSKYLIEQSKLKVRTYEL